MANNLAQKSGEHTGIPPAITHSVSPRRDGKLGQNTAAASLKKILKAFKLQYLIQIKERLLYRRAQDDFYRTLGGHIFFETLYSAVELDLFNLLERSGPLTAQEIAKEIGVDEQPCRILLLGLVSARIIKKKRERYSNNRLSKIFLTENGKWRYSDCIKWQHHINYRPLFHLSEAIVKNRNVGIREIEGDEPTLYQRLAHNRSLETIFQNAMSELSNQCNHLLSEYIDFSAVTSVVDVGGGVGTNLSMLARRYPHLQGSVFDFPTICERARENFGRLGLIDRFDAVEGSVMSDDIPTGYDCVLFCHFFTIWSLEENEMLLKKAFRALPSGGRAIIFNMMQNDSGDGPLMSAIGSPYFLTLATGRGMLYSWHEYEELFRRAGFINIERRRLPRDHGVIIGYRP